MKHIKRRAISLIAMATLWNANLMAWDDHPDDDDPIYDINMFKIISKLSPEEQKECIRLLEKDEDDRIFLEYLIAKGA